MNNHSGTCNYISNSTSFFTTSAPDSKAFEVMNNYFQSNEKVITIEPLKVYSFINTDINSNNDNYFISQKDYSLLKSKIDQPSEPNEELKALFKQFSV